MTNKLFISLAIAAGVLGTTLPYSTDVNAAGFQQEKREKRPTNLVGPNVGKKVQKAFEAYTNDDIDGAIEIMLDSRPKGDYDTAYVDRFLGNMIAQKGDYPRAIEYLEKAVAPDVLNEAEQADALKLLGQLTFSEKQYDKSIKVYHDWMTFTGKEESKVWVSIAQAYRELGQLDKVIAPSDNAIRLDNAEGKPNQNPYILKVHSYYERKMFQETIGVLETVVQIFPENKAWWVQLGSFYSLVEDFKKALYTLELAHKQGFLDKESHIRSLASLYAANNVPYKAAKLLDEHINSGLIPRDERSIGQLANYWHSAMEITKAASAYGELAKLSNDPKHYQKQGVLLNQAEKHSSAEQPLKKAIELGTADLGKAYIALMESYFYQGKYKLALEMNAEAMKDVQTRRNARAWTEYIKETAKRRGVNI